MVFILNNWNSNTIDKRNRGIVLQSKIYERAKDIFKGIPFEKIATKDGMNLIIIAIHKIDALSVVSLDIKNSSLCSKHVVRTTRYSVSINVRFGAHIATFNSLGSSLTFPGVEQWNLLCYFPTWRLTIISDAASNERSLNIYFSTNDVIYSVSYETIDYVLRQCDKRTNADRRSHNYDMASNHSSNRNHS